MWAQMPPAPFVESPSAILPATRAPLWLIEPPQDGMVIVRIPGVAEPEPSDWRARLKTSLRQLPGVMVVGAKRLASDGRLFSMGEFVIHPKGFHHLGRGVSAEAYRFPQEVDTIAGGVFAVDQEAFEAVGGDDLLVGQLGALELGLIMRRTGGRCVAVPDVLVTECFTPQPDAQERTSFIDRWGFDWRIADLDVVRQAYSGTGLLWNVRLHGSALPFDKYRHRPAMHWASYEQAEPFRRRADHLAQLVAQTTASGHVLDLGCGDGLFSHLIAQRGLEVIGLDPEPVAIEQAEAQTANQRYPGPPPRFIVGCGEELPLDDGSVQTVVMFDVIEHLPNPLASLRALARVLAPGGHLVISTPAWHYGQWSDPVYHVCEYTMGELVGQVQAIPGLHVVKTGMIKGIYRDLIVMAERT